MRVLLAYSGGLDTSFLVAWLTREKKAEVTALAVDCGGFSADEKGALRERAQALGAVDFRLVDARDELFSRVIRWLVAANVRRGEVYPLSVGAERGLQAEVLARVAREGKFDAVAHGCTAAGNDQVRFEAALATIAPGLTALAPVRDLGLSRDDERKYLSEKGLPVPPAGGRYSVNAGLWGLTIGGGETHDSFAAIPDSAWQWTREGKGTRAFEIGFEKGVPASLDGKRMAPVAIIETLNHEAGALGVGRGYHLGDTVLGIKGRIAFEAPAAEVLLTAHRELEKLVLTEDQRFWKDHLGDVYGRRLHQGLFHDPFQRDLEAFFASTQERVTGAARVRCRDGAALVEGVKSPFSLMAASDARYGERAASGSDPAGALGLARIFAEPARLYRRAAERAAGDAASDRKAGEATR
ncbi:MAG TPA: argininosuccinate synthase [Planctomycetota bacterium]|nr:argininosuccinate synthase [Planctomycetota bacterium]